MSLSYYLSLINKGLLQVGLAEETLRWRFHSESLLESEFWLKLWKGKADSQTEQMERLSQNIVTAKNSASSANQSYKEHIFLSVSEGPMPLYLPRPVFTSDQPYNGSITLVKETFLP